MKSTFETLIVPCAVELTPAGRREAERIKSGLLACGCYESACYCGQYPTFAELCEMEAEADAARPQREPMTEAEWIEAEELRNFFGNPHLDN